MAGDTRQGGDNKHLTCNNKTITRHEEKALTMFSEVDQSPQISWKAALEIDRNEKNEQRRERIEGVEAKTLFTILGGSRSACTEQRDAADQDKLHWPGISWQRQWGRTAVARQQKMQRGIIKNNCIHKRLLFALNVITSLDKRMQMFNKNMFIDHPNNCL